MKSKIKSVYEVNSTGGRPQTLRSLPKRKSVQHSIPRPEIDVLAMEVTTSDVLAVEIKSIPDSPGAKLKHLEAEYDVAKGTYKLFTSTRYREIVFSRLRQDL